MALQEIYGYRSTGVSEMSGCLALSQRSKVATNLWREHVYCFSNMLMHAVCLVHDG